MKSNGTLQKHYDQLTARERMALLLESVARSDDRERDALLASAPRVLYRLPHHHNIFVGFTYLQMSYLIHQLHRAWTIASLAHMADASDASPISERAWRAVCVAAYVFCVQADAWRAFCGEIGVDVQASFKGFDDVLLALDMSERIAREFAFTFEETRAEMVKDFGDDGADVITVERALSDLRAVFNEFAER